LIVTKYKIAWLPGDGIGAEVMEAARIVLDEVGLDAEYIPGDIGWEWTLDVAKEIASKLGS